MEKTWKNVAQSQDREGRAKENIALLKDELATLSRLVERGASLSLSQENDVKQLRVAREELQRQVDEQAVQLSLLEGKLQEQNSYQGELREQCAAHLVSIADLREKLVAKEADNVREIKRRLKTQKELQDSKASLDEKVRVEEELRREMELSRQRANDLQRQLSDAQLVMDKQLREYEGVLARTQRAAVELDAQARENKRLQTEMASSDKEAKLRQAEVERLKSDNLLLERRVDMEHGAALAYKQAAADAKTPFLDAQAEIASLKTELLNTRKVELGLEKRAEAIAREKETQVKLHFRAEARAKEQADLRLEQERLAADLTGEVRDFVAEAAVLRKALRQLEGERERLVNELTEQRALVTRSEEDGKVKAVQMSELQKNIGEWETKLKHQQQLYERARTDKAHYSKALIEAQDEMAEMRKKSKIMGQQVGQLKEEIQVKEEGMVREHFEFLRADKLKDHLQIELNEKASLIRQNLEMSQQQEEELKKLNNIIRRMDDEDAAQRKEYDQVVSQRDILGTQLIRRNDELALLYEKLRVFQSALSAGEAQYANRLDDIRVLRGRVRELQHDDAVNKTTKPQIEGLKKEVLKLQQALYGERLKVTALSEELENPLNVHRWRKLEGSDPAGFELIQKVQTLQKRLIAKTEEVVEKAMIVKEKDQMYQELKEMLARQPGPEVAEQLSVYQTNMKTKTRQMKALTAELNMYQAQVNEYRYEVERVTRDLQDMKSKYYQLKKREEQRMEATAVPPLPAVVSRSAPSFLLEDQQAAARRARPKFAGGGYAIK